MVIFQSLRLKKKSCSYIWTFTCAHFHVFARFNHQVLAGRSGFIAHHIREPEEERLAAPCYELKGDVYFY